MYYKLNNTHIYYIDDRKYVCIGNVWEWDENWKFVRFIWMEEAFDIINNWVIDPNIHLKSKQDKKREKQKEQPLF